MGRLVYRYRWFVLVVWGALLVLGAFFAPNLSDRLKGGGFEGANSDAEKVQEIMAEEFDASPSTITMAPTSASAMRVVPTIARASYQPMALRRRIFLM